jgi:endonuclease YncB( thermonuclease family)
LGNAACIPGIVTKIVDGDTIKVHGKSVRFAMASTPELNEAGGIEAKKFVESICPVGSNVTIDEDDKETWGSYDRMIGVIYCNDLILDEELLKAGHTINNTKYCSKSEFADTSWAKQFGC